MDSDCTLFPLFADCHVKLWTAKSLQTVVLVGYHSCDCERRHEQSVFPAVAYCVRFPREPTSAYKYNTSPYRKSYPKKFVLPHNFFFLKAVKLGFLASEFGRAPFRCLCLATRPTCTPSVFSPSCFSLVLKAGSCVKVGRIAVAGSLCVAFYSRRPRSVCTPRLLNLH